GLENQGKIQQASTMAEMKKLRGQPLTQEDQAAIDANTKQTMGNVMAISGDTENPETDLPPIQNEPPQGNYPYSKTPGFIDKLGKGQNQDVRQVRLPGSLDSAQQEQDVNNTLDRLGFQGTAAQQHAQLQPKMTELNNWIENESSLN